MKNGKFIGLINLKDKIIVSDPYFAVGTKNQGNIDNVIPGTYNCFVLEDKDSNWGTKVRELFIINSNSPISRDQINTLIDTRIKEESGTIGIFDYDYYKKYHNDPFGDDYKIWYKKNVLEDYPDYRITSESGVWSICGYGDGICKSNLHECFVHLDDAGKINGIRIIFMKEEE